MSFEVQSNPFKRNEPEPYPTLVSEPIKSNKNLKSTSINANNNQENYYPSFNKNSYRDYYETESYQPYEYGQYNDYDYQTNWNMRPFALYSQSIENKRNTEYRKNLSNFEDDIYPSDNWTWLFMDMDFTKTAGDSIITQADRWTPWLYDILSVSDTVLVNSTDQQVRKYMLVKSPWRLSLTEDIWIEGIGSVTTGIDNCVLGYHKGGFSQLIKCYVGDEVLYEHAFDKKTPQFTYLGIDKVVNGSSPSVYTDLQGRRVKTPTRGVYIRDGRKVVVK